MTTIAVFMVQVGIPIAIGILATLYLRGVTQSLLVDLCGTVERAAFWMRITIVLTIAAPLGLVLIFARTLSSCSLAADACLGAARRQALSLSVMGIVVAVGLLARVVWKQVSDQGAAAQPEHKP